MAGRRKDGSVVDLAVEILKDIRGELQGLRAAVDQVNVRLDQTNARLDETNARLERVERGLVRLEDRFDHFLTFAGTRYPEHEERLRALERRVYATGGGGSPPVP